MKIYESIEDLEMIVEEDASNEKERELLKRLANVDGYHGLL